MTEKYIGQAKHYKQGNNLFWKYRDIVLDSDGNLVMDDDGRLESLELRWTKGYKDCELCKGNDGKTYRIDFITRNVYEVVS